MFGFKTGPLMRQYAVVITVNLSVYCAGLGIAWPSPVLVKLRNANETVLSTPMTEEEGSWIVSIGFLCSLCANFLPALLLDRLGRKYCVILACLPRLLACLMFTFATQVWMILVGRAMSGVSEFMIFTVVPIYASEVASKEVRGSLGTIVQISSSLGILAMLGIGPFISYLPLNVLYTCVTVLTTVPLLFLPESPYFLYSKGRTSEAVEVLTFLRGSEDQAHEEIREYSKANSDEKIEKIQLFRNKVYVKTICIVVVLGFGAQMVGFNVISFYLQTILESTHTSIRPEFASVAIGCIQLFSSLCTALVSDKFGRKPIVASTTIAMSLGMIGLGAFFKQRETQDSLSGFMNVLPLMSFVLVVFGYSAGIGSMFWMLITELFEGPGRSVGVSCSIVTSLIIGFIITKYFASLSHAIGPPATYWLFAVNCVLFSLFICFCVPETKGKTFAEIQVALGAEEKVDSEKCSKETKG